MKRFRAWLDAKVFWLAYNSINRHLKRERWIAYIWELSLRRHREENPLDPKIAAACEYFHAEMWDCKLVHKFHERVNK